MKIVADCDIPYLKGVLEPYAHVEYLKGADISPENIRDADALIIRTRTVCNRQMLERSKVRFIGTATIGTDHIDIPYCRQAGITVCSAAGCNARGVLQWVSAVLSRICDKYAFKPAHTTLGIIGVGNVGKIVAEYARMWGFEVLCNDPLRQNAEKLTEADGFVDKEKLLGRSDIVSLHTPLTKTGPYATFHMIDSHAIKKMKNGAILLNCARGGIADEVALRLAMENGKLQGAAIDTWEREPNIDLRLLELCDISTPHIAGYSIQGKAAGTSMTVKALARFFGLPLTEWYPAGIQRSAPQKITWQYLHENMNRYFDIETQSRDLKNHPEKFEEMRNKYEYRTEFF